MELCTSLQRKQTQMDTKIKDQDLKISGLKARVKFLEDKDRGSAEPTQEDGPIKRGIIKTREEVEADKSTELGSNDTYEMINVPSSMEAANILTSGVVAVSVSPVAGVSTKGVPTVSGLFPTASAIFTTASVVKPYTRRSREILAKDKGNEKVVESEVPKKRKLQEQIDVQVAREIEEEFARENKRLNEQLTRDSKIERLHAEEELKMMIEGLNKSNEVIAKHLQEYKQAAADLSVGEKNELINELVKYQDHHAKILKYQAQQSKLLLKKEQREFYMSVLRSHARWKTRHFRGMTLEKIKEKFIPVWKQLEDFVPMSSKEEGERVKRQGLKIDQGSSKRMKTFEDVSKKDLKGMMQLVPLEEVYVEALQVELKKLFEPDFEDQLWTHNQSLMHDPLEWKLYDTCGVHHVFTKDQEIFMLVEKDYPLRKGLATMMICNNLQEIDGPEARNFVDFGNIHGESTLQELDEFCRKKRKIVGAHLIGRIAIHFRLMSTAALRLGEIDQSIYYLGGEVEELTKVVSWISEQYDQFYGSYKDGKDALKLIIPVFDIVLRRCPLGLRGHHSLSLFNRSDQDSCRGAVVKKGSSPFPLGSSPLPLHSVCRKQAPNLIRFGQGAIANGVKGISSNLKNENVGRITISWNKRFPQNECVRNAYQKGINEADH
nr:hypothetical protein [Tanacetum cinerariifolium]